jgi:hypothetical protein
MDIIKIPTRSYERIIPTNVEEAMVELDRRIMITAKENLGQVQARVIFRELLEDYTQGMSSRTQYILTP